MGGKPGILWFSFIFSLLWSSTLDHSALLLPPFNSSFLAESPSSFLEMLRRFETFVVFGCWQCVDPHQARQSECYWWMLTQSLSLSLFLSLSLSPSLSAVPAETLFLSRVKATDVLIFRYSSPSWSKINLLGMNLIEFFSLWFYLVPIGGFLIENMSEFFVGNSWRAWTKLINWFFVNNINN